MAGNGRICLVRKPFTLICQICGKQQDALNVAEIAALHIIHNAREHFEFLEYIRDIEPEKLEEVLKTLPEVSKGKISYRHD